MFARLRTNDARLYWPNLCKEVWSENVLFVLCSQVTLGVKKLCRRAYGRTINILPLPFAGRPGHIVVHQTPSNGSPIDSVIIYAPLMRLTPVYWLLFACRVTFSNSHTHTHALFPPQTKIIKQYQDTASTWPLSMASPRWRKKNSQRISGQMWVYIWSVSLDVFLCVFVWRGHRALLGQMGLLGPLWLSAHFDSKMR